MKYILAMFSDETEWQSLTPEQMQAFDEHLTAFNEELRASGAWVSAAGFEGGATLKTVRFGADSPTVADGPHSDAAEQLAGFWIIEAGSADEAVEWATKTPLGSGAIEVRPLVIE